MKYSFSFFLLVLFNLAGYSQQTIDYADQYAKKVAQRMEDSIGITEQQKSMIYKINSSIAEQKKAVWQNYTNRDSVQVYIQAIEDKRNSLYNGMLTYDQYEAYLQKKHNILNNN